MVRCAKSPEVSGVVDRGRPVVSGQQAAVDRAAGRLASWGGRPELEKTQRRAWRLGRRVPAVATPSTTTTTKQTVDCCSQSVHHHLEQYQEPVHCPFRVASHSSCGLPLRVYFCVFWCLRDLWRVTILSQLFMRRPISTIIAIFTPVCVKHCMWFTTYRIANVINWLFVNICT